MKENHSKPKWPTLIFDALNKLLPRLSIFWAKCTPFYSSLIKNLSQDDWTLLDKHNT